MEYIVNNPTEMKEVALSILDTLPKTLGGAQVLALNGELGAGKTTFTKALAGELGVNETVTSPTFVIQKSYTLNGNHRFNKLVHIDAYRLQSATDLDALNFADTVQNEKNLIVIEWADNIKDALPDRVINIDFQYINETTRKITCDMVN